MTNYIIPPENLEDLARKFKLGPYATKPKEQKAFDVKKDFWIIEMNDKYCLYNVKFNEEMYDIEWKKELLENGELLTQDQALEKTQNNDFIAPSSVVYTASINALYENKDHPNEPLRKKIQEIRNMFAEDFNGASQMITSTRVMYSPYGQDEVIHNYSRTLAPHVGPCEILDCQISRIGQLEDIMKPLLGTTKVIESYYWISGKPPVFFTGTQKPDKVTQAIVKILTWGENLAIHASSSPEASGLVRCAQVRKINITL